MSWATPIRSHVVVTTMARSITVERSVPALLGLARVSGLGMGMATARVFCFIRALEVNLKEFYLLNNKVCDSDAPTLLVPLGRSSVRDVGDGVTVAASPWRVTAVSCPPNPCKKIRHLPSR